MLAQLKYEGGRFVAYILHAWYLCCPIVLCSELIWSFIFYLKCDGMVLSKFQIYEKRKNSPTVTFLFLEMFTCFSGNVETALDVTVVSLFLVFW